MTCEHMLENDDNPPCSECFRCGGCEDNYKISATAEAALERKGVWR